jgi:hypothetical protein
MSTFELKTDLPHGTQVEIDRIQAITAARRLSNETAFLVSLAPYLTNEVLLYDENDLIVIAAGYTVPTGYAGFKVGAMFIDVDSAAVYVNTGTTASASFNNINSISSAEIATGAVTVDKLATSLDLTGVALSNLRIESGTPVNAVAATQILELTGDIVAGSHAESVLTSNATNVTDGDTVTIGTTVYRFKDTMAAAYDVKIGADAATTLDNLKAAINGTGTAGVEWFAGTAAHPTVVATTNADTTQKVVARLPGTAANTLATTKSAATLSWPAATLGDGTGLSNPGVAPETVTVDTVVYSFVDVLSETNGAAAVANQVLFGASSAAALDNLKLAINAGATAGTNYSTGTVVHPTVTATTNENASQVVAAKVKGTAAESIAVDDTIADGAWAGATLASGVDGTVGIARQVLLDANYLYVCTAANTIADANWKKVDLGSAY